jgi:hypothetical protein
MNDEDRADLIWIICTLTGWILLAIVGFSVDWRFGLLGISLFFLTERGL